MPIIKSFDYNNKVRDLTGVLSTLIAGASNFLSNFPKVADAKQRKHEWLELHIRPRSFATTAITTGGVCTVTPEESAKCYAGQLVSLATDPAVFRVTTITPTAVTLEFVASNGSSIASVSNLPTGGGTFRIQSAPMPSGSSSGEDTFRQSGTEHNFTQIFRKNFTLARTSMSVDVYGNQSVAIINAKAVVGSVIFICNSVPYAVALEHGHSPQAAGGVVEPVCKIMAAAIRAGRI